MNCTQVTHAQGRQDPSTAVACIHAEGHNGMHEGYAMPFGRIKWKFEEDTVRLEIPTFIVAPPKSKLRFLKNLFRAKDPVSW